MVRPTSTRQAVAALGRSAPAGWRQRRAFADVESFCLFVGYPRSGHTLVGAFLNAHRHMVIAQELDALRYVRLGARRSQLFALLLERDRQFADKGWRWQGYDYRIDGQCQGTFEQLRVIGDKRAGGTATWLDQRPDLLDRLRRVVGVPLRVVHVVRNPFDNVATIARRQHTDLAVAAGHYGDLVRSVAGVRQRLDRGELLDVRYEAVVDDPTGAVLDICRFLGLDAPLAYRQACAAKVVGRSPSRHRTSWDPESRAAVEALVDRWPFLAGYRLDGD